MAIGSSANDGGAPWYKVPDEAVMLVEHPCIVKNTSKGIDMLGGARAISQSLDLGTERTLALSFKPDDPSSRTVLSLHNQTNNVLLKVTVPARTGRKRKRGSNGPFLEENDASSTIKDASYLLRSMEENVKSYDIEAVGRITSSQVWRSMPDMVYSTRGLKFMQEIERNILPKSYESMKRYFLHTENIAEASDAIPPPVLSTQSVPYNYLYRQNQAVAKLTDGGSSATNRATSVKIYVHQWQFDNPTIPTKPMDMCPPLEDQSIPIQEIVEKLQPLFEHRHIWSRRALLNQLPDDTPFFLVRNSIAYVAFSIKSGPWRDTLCKFGIDPRTDRSYRKYQSILLQLNPKGKGSESNNNADVAEKSWVRDRDIQSHIFTGTKPVPADGKIWQLCDIEDDQLKNLVDVPDLFLRSQCEIRYFGWYLNSTFAKIKILLKIKIDQLVAGIMPEPSTFDRFLSLPDHVDLLGDATKGDVTTGYLPKDASKEELEWASAYRTILRTSAGTLPTYGALGKGRISLLKPRARPSYIDLSSHRARYENDGFQGGPAAASEEAAEDEDDNGSEHEFADRYAEPEEQNEDEDENEEGNNEMDGNEDEGEDVDENENEDDQEAGAD